MLPSRDTKSIAQRIDLRYISRPSWFRWLRRWAVLLSSAGALAFVVYVVAGTLSSGRHQRMLNPGPVAQFHAHFENNCAACHDADGKGAFFKTVSDHACLNCHDAGAHQPRADLNPGNAHAVHLTSLDHLKAANCAWCHSEHRGPDLLRGLDNRLCLQCHADLNAHGGGGGVARTVLDFKLGRHPEFGRTLPRATAEVLQAATQPVGSGWADPAEQAVSFRHGVHMELKKADGSRMIAACTSCHGADEVAPPSRRYLRPVTYEAHCQSCHPIALPKTDGLPTDLGPPLAHGRMDLIRAQLSDLPHQYLAYLASARSPAEVAGGASPEDWSKQHVEKLTEILKSKATLLDNNYHDRLDKLQTTLKAQNRTAEAEELDKTGDDLVDAAKKDVRALAEYAVMFLNDNTKCVKCHRIEGEPPVLYEKLLAMSMKAKTPTTLPAALHTAATGIESTPRRWFAHAEFDHDKHRDVSCLSCHAGMDRDRDDGIARLPAMQSCVQCHRPDTATARGAGANCVTCHVFHDRALEREPGGHIKP